MAQSTLNTRIILRNDSLQNWELNKSTILMKGEVGIEFDPQPSQGGQSKIRMKIGDGIRTWEELPYYGGTDEQVFDIIPSAEETDDAAITRVVGVVELHAGDTAIVKRLIANDKYSYTAYVYNGTAWKVMDGNCNAKNVIFDSDLTFTEPVGTVTIGSSGSAKVDAAGKNLYDVLSGIFAEEDAAKLLKTNPSLSVSTGLSYAEVGATVTPSYSLAFNKGKYKYEPADTGVTASNYKATHNSETVSGQTGSFSAFTFGANAGDEYKITASCDHTAGATPKSNIGTEYSDQAIKSGSASAPEKAIYKSYKPNFYGFYTDVGHFELNAQAFTSEVIRAIPNKQIEGNTALKTSVTTESAWAQFVYAVPSDKATSVEVQDTKTGLPCTSIAITGCTVNHEGSVSSQYTVFVVDNAEPTDPTTLKLTWKK